jgi:hypothetical protein
VSVVSDKYYFDIFSHRVQCKTFSAMVAANMAHNVNIGLIYWKIKVKIVFPRNQTFD